MWPSRKITDGNPRRKLVGHLQQMRSSQKGPSETEGPVEEGIYGRSKHLERGRLGGIARILVGGPQERGQRAICTKGKEDKHSQEVEGSSDFY